MDRYVWQLLKGILSTSEYNALISNLRNESYSYKDFIRAKKKLRAMGMDIKTEGCV
jgi:hypothetical protein